jgi:arginyl-tRNA synthetase
LLHKSLEREVAAAVARVLPDIVSDEITVRPAADPRFGDYQCSALIGVAKKRGLPPRDLASQVAATLDVATWCEPIEIAGAGFLNFRLKPEAIVSALRDAHRRGELFFDQAAKPRTLVIDFSSPNVAKPMHVGHIRSTILGDSLARISRLLGHRVITDNHIGDWGTQFGMLLQQVLTSQPGVAEHPEQFEINDLEAFYRDAKRRFDSEPGFAEAARRAVVDLQSGEPTARKIWEVFCKASMRHCEAVYRRLGVNFDVVLGESFYNARLPGIVAELRAAQIAHTSDGAEIVSFENDPELKKQPAIVQKSDGGFNYTTTDLATLEYRLTQWRPDEVVYVTDDRQQLHFKQLFAVFRRWHPGIPVKLVHVWFGTILGPDGKPFKTRSGENIKLSELLDEAQERAFQVVTEKNPELPENQRREIARVVGVGSIKYADLLPNRQSAYTFDWDKMLALNGNTAPYLQYGYTRIRSIRRKILAGDAAAGFHDQFQLTAIEEIGLAKHLLTFGLTLEAAAAEYRPNYLCNYLYELASKFARFYEACPVLKAEEPERSGRLALCDLTGATLKQGLDALGIETIEQM